MTDSRSQQLEERLRKQLQIESLEVIDESHLHAGHVGAKSGKGHFRLVLWAQEFNDKAAIKCHRLIYDAVGDLLETDIHALSIELLPPTKANQ